MQIESTKDIIKVMVIQNLMQVFFTPIIPGISDAVMGMDGYGGIALLINFDDNRIVYTHAVHRNYNYKSLVLKAIDKGTF